MLGMLLIATVFLILVGLNVYATVVIVGSTETPRSRKWPQCLFVWLLPVVGAVLALAAHKPSTDAAHFNDADVGVIGEGANLDSSIGDIVGHGGENGGH
jgi:hypothetical protein